MPSRSPWIRIVTEGFVIVISILLAFGIDAYWDERGEATEEREVLLGLQGDFEDLRSRLEQWATYNETGVLLINQFLSDSVASLDREVADGALVRSVLTNVLDQGGPLEALFASGRLELIRNPEIRAALAKWPDWLEDIHTNDLSRRDNAMLNIQPHLHRHGWPGFDLTGCGRPLCLRNGEMPDSYLEMSRDPELRAALHMRVAEMRGGANDHSMRIPEADRLLELIREELASR